MAATRIETVADYLAAQPPATRAILRRVRAIIRKAMPDAVESLSYRMPTYRLPGGGLLYFAGWKQHVSLYPTTAALIAAYRRDLAPHLASKDTLRFPLDQPVPFELIERVARFRAKEGAAATTKPARKKAR